MTIRILASARDDLVDGWNFYEEREQGTGDYFLQCLFEDIALLKDTAGLHRMVQGFHRSLSRRFPYAVYYLLHENEVRIHAVLDCRSNPKKIRQKLRQRR